MWYLIVSIPDLCTFTYFPQYMTEAESLAGDFYVPVHNIPVISRRPSWVEPVYKYNILERVIVENIIPRNVIINRGAAEGDNHISRDDFSTITLSRMLYLFYYIDHYSFFSTFFALIMVREVPRTAQCAFATNG